jgi:3-isopropylmalate dehydrogenase
VGGGAVTYRVILLPGDGIGPEVVRAAGRVLDAVAGGIEYTEVLAGGSAIDAYGTPLRDADLDTCRQADAILFGAVGGPAWDALPVDRRPERALLRLRSELNLGINFRPVRWTSAGEPSSPLKREVAEGADIAFVRELTGGVYFGRPSYIKDDEKYAVDTADYSERQITAVLDFAYELARTRQGKVTSVDKANVMNTSRLWRQVASDYGRRHPDVQLEHALVDSFAMSLIQSPRRYDVVVTENLFGDILTDLAGVIAGSLGLLPSASLRADTGDTRRANPLRRADPRSSGPPLPSSPDRPAHESIGGQDTHCGGYPGPGPTEIPTVRRFGMYEPIHGSAPDIAGRGIANPVGSILSAALMLEWSLGQPEKAHAIREAVQFVIEERKVLTADLATESSVSTQEFVDAVVTHLQGGSRGHRDLRHNVA